MHCVAGHGDSLEQPHPSFRAWQGIEIEATYTPRRWTVIDHLEIRGVARAPLPITATGYLSHFMQPGTIEAHGGDVAEQVIAWLDEDAAKLEWLALVETNSHGELF